MIKDKTKNVSGDPWIMLYKMIKVYLEGNGEIFKVLKKGSNNLTRFMYYKD